MNWNLSRTSLSTGVPKLRTRHSFLFPSTSSHSPVTISVFHKEARTRILRHPLSIRSFCILLGSPPSLTITTTPLSRRRLLRSSKLQSTMVRTSVERSKSSIPITRFMTRHSPISTDPTCNVWRLSGSCTTLLM